MHMADPGLGQTYQVTFPKDQTASKFTSQSVQSGDSAGIGKAGMEPRLQLSGLAGGGLDRTECISITEEPNISNSARGY